MFIERDIEHYKKLKKYTLNRRMLMIGNQASEIGDGRDIFGVADYKTLDPDGGDYPVDLTGDMSSHYLNWDVVFNLGTIEHIWDIHSAYCNVAKMVRVGGFFINHAPFGPDYTDHGINLTNYKAILRFFEINGFINIEHWFSVNTILWHVAIKVDHVENFKVPMQLWNNFNVGNIN